MQVTQETTEKKLPMRTKILLGLLVVALIILVLNFWQPWQRQPVVFYEPLILPLETLKGDIIVLENGSHIDIDRDKRINAIEYTDGQVTIESTIHVNLWELLTSEVK